MTAASEARRAVKRRRIKRLAIADAALLFGVALAAGVSAVNSAPSVQADEISRPPAVAAPEQADDPGARGGPIAPIFDDAPRYDPGKDGALIVDGPPLDHPRSTGSTATRATRTTAPPAVAGPVAPPATTPPPAGDPLTDDGTFGDGCEQPGTPERCDPELNDPRTDDGDVGDGCEEPGTPERCDPVVGLPPVIVEEEPAEEETPVDEVEVVETVTEVEG